MESPVETSSPSAPNRSLSGFLSSLLPSQSRGPSFQSEGGSDSFLFFPSSPARKPPQRSVARLVARHADAPSQPANEPDLQLPSLEEKSDVLREMSGVSDILSKPQTIDPLNQPQPVSKKFKMPSIKSKYARDVIHALHASAGEDHLQQWQMNRVSLRGADDSLREPSEAGLREPSVAGLSEPSVKGPGYGGGSFRLELTGESSLRLFSHRRGVAFYRPDSSSRLNEVSVSHPILSPELLVASVRSPVEESSWSELSRIQPHAVRARGRALERCEWLTPGVPTCGRPRRCVYQTHCERTGASPC